MSKEPKNKVLQKNKLVIHNHLHYIFLNKIIFFENQNVAIILVKYPKTIKLLKFY